MSKRDGEEGDGEEREMRQRDAVRKTRAGETMLGRDGLCVEQGFLNCLRILRSLRQECLEY